MEKLNTSASLQPSDAANASVSFNSGRSSTVTALEVGDTVGFDYNVEEFPLTIGTILSIKAADKDRGTDDRIVVQVGPKVLGIYRAEQLVRLRSGSD
jgi:hypothetical protein